MAQRWTRCHGRQNLQGAATIQRKEDVKNHQSRKSHRQIALERIIRKFNLYPAKPNDQRFVTVMRLPSPEKARLSVATHEESEVEGWYQDEKNLMALYHFRGALIMFDRISSDGEINTVTSVVAAGPDVVERAIVLLKRDQRQESDELLLFEVDNG